jgi:aminopeptidase N
MSKQVTEHKPIYLKDYQAPDYLIEQVKLHITLHATKTLVHSQLQICRNQQIATHQRPLILHGEELECLKVIIDGKTLNEAQYQVQTDSLILDQVPQKFSLEILTRIAPQQNHALSGLYRSAGLFCTQCEAQGFRRITYYLDRPDVMAEFTTTLVADKSECPVLLSNGNLVAQGDLAENQHWATWHDPFKKPAYLFALVAGQLACIQDTFITQTQREILLELYVTPENLHKGDFALQALKKAMRWDETAYNLEYDLTRFMIVAVNDFNMGAMENKGLNIFNTKYILADTLSATDSDFQNIEAVVGHEYFHNWTGNRITCRDWFQLSLKEGLTVFREQQFAAQQGSSAVKRIEQARLMRTRQFAEDAGPMAHPVRPSAYIEINNFYTMTVYDKGAEVIRMLHTLLGESAFQEGMKLYVQRHDGQAVTIDDFVAAMAQANAQDFEQFKRWYYQAGTPIVEATGHYNKDTAQYTLRLTQTCPPSADGSPKDPFYIPIRVGLLDAQNQPLALHCHTAFKSEPHSVIVVLNEVQQDFVFDKVFAAPVPSLLGDFSAPIKLNYAYSNAQLAVLIAHDPNLFNRWDAMQQLFSRLVLAKLPAQSVPGNADCQLLIDALKQLLQHPPGDWALVAEMLNFPSFSYLAELVEPIDVPALVEARQAVVQEIAMYLAIPLKSAYNIGCQANASALDANNMGLRALKNSCLGLLVQTGHLDDYNLAQQQFQQAQTMTETMGALVALNQKDTTLRHQLLEDFYQQWKNDPLVVDKWLTLHATAPWSETLTQVEQLLTHPAFSLHNPNKVYALLKAFAQNPLAFHRQDGRGYQLLAAQVLKLDRHNPQVAARLVGSLIFWKRYIRAYAEPMQRVLVDILQQPQLSKDVYEIVHKALS